MGSTQKEEAEEEAEGRGEEEGQEEEEVEGRGGAWLCIRWWIWKWCLKS